MIRTHKRILLSSALVAVAAIGFTSDANAQDGFTLTDDNSSVHIDPYTNAGMDSWVVDETDHLHQQWFWFRVGESQNETSIDNLELMSTILTDTNGSGNDDTAFFRFGGDSFTIETTYTLRGGAWGTTRADIGELIEITNTGRAPLVLSFFQYSDFDMGGESESDTVSIVGGNTARQFNTDGYGVSETVVTPSPFAFEAAEYSQTVDNLNDGSLTILNNNANASGDVTWAFQWDIVLNVGESFQISKDKSIVPAPGSFALFGIGAMALGTRRRRRA